VPVDFFKRSEIALQHARRISRENNGNLVLLHVLNENMFHSRRMVPSSHSEKQARDGLKRLAARRASSLADINPLLPGAGMWRRRFQIRPKNSMRQ
jgi:nucleotide-binding universal stress UspA family protein